jgi:hypothetical protein
MSIDDFVELEIPPQPEAQPDIAERTRVGPSHGFQADPHDIRIVWQVDVLVVGEEPELTTVSLPVVKHDGALPTPFLVVVELTEIGDHTLSRPGLGADALHQSVIRMRLAVLGAVIASQEHDRPSVRIR